MPARVDLVVLQRGVQRVAHAQAGEMEDRILARQRARELLRVAHVPVEEDRGRAPVSASQPSRLAGSPVARLS